MRGWRVAAAALAACHAAPLPAEPPRARPSLAIVGLEAPDGAHALAASLTDELRVLAAARDARFELVARREELRDLRQLASCPDRTAPACIAAIGAFLDADYLLWGDLEARPGGYALRLELMDVAHRFNRRAYFAPVAAGTAKDAFAKLVASW